MDDEFKGHLDHIEEIASTDPAGARTIIEMLDLTRAPRESRVRAAMIAERLGAIDAAIAFWNLVLADSPLDGAALRSLVEIRQDRGETDEAARLLKLLSESGDAGAEGKLAGLLADSGELAVSSPEAKYERSVSASDAELAALCDLFAGREGVHARQWRGQDGRTGYSPAEQPITPALWRQHLLGSITIGVYPVRRDGTVSFFALDVDVSAATRKEIQRQGGKLLNRALKDTLAVAVALTEVVSEFGLHPYLEHSGFKGYHVWVFFESPWPAALARRLGLAVLSRVRPLRNTVSVDVFPAQSRVASDGLGNLIKLPLGVHLGTGARSAMVDPGGLPLPEQVASLVRATREPAAVLEKALERAESGIVVQDEEKGPAEQEAGPPPADGPARLSRYQETPVLPPYSPDEDKELQKVLSNCEPLNEIVKAARSGANLSHDQKAVLTYTLGHLTNGPEAVNMLIRPEEVGGEGRGLVSRLRGNPMSCRKLRDRIKLPSAIERRVCICRFDPTLGQYPHPLLHLAALADETKPEIAAEGGGDGVEAPDNVVKFPGKPR